MKNKDLSNAIGNINLKYVEEAENFTAKRMSLTKIVSLAACIAILVTAIPMSLILNRKDVSENSTPITTVENVNNNNPQNEEDFEIIYCSAESIAKKQEHIRKTLENEKLQVKEFVPLTISVFLEKEKIGYNENVPQKLEVTLSGVSYSFDFMYVYNYNAIKSTNETVQSYAMIAKYQLANDDGLRGTILYCVESGLIVEFHVKYDKDFCINGDMTADEIQKIAKKDLAYLYGEEKLADFQFERIVESSTLGFCAVYRRYVGIYKTDEVIITSYTHSGVLYDIFTWYLGIYDIAAEYMNEAVLAAAEKEAVEKFGGRLVLDHLLVMGLDGVPYMCAKVKCTDEELSEFPGIGSYMVYYKVKLE